MKFLVSLTLILSGLFSSVYAQYDLVVVGGNPGGIMAAISAARLGKTSVILERTHHIGGLPGNGLGATDIATRGATTGLFTEFVGRIKEHYINKYGQNSSQVLHSSDGYHFESSVAEMVLEQMLEAHKDKITVLKMRQFDVDDKNITLSGNLISKIRVTNRLNGKEEEFSGAVFIDATYEGDLGAAAKVPFRVGREAKAEFNEIGAGRVYKYWMGPEASGTTFQGDNAVQAYNYRLCLTNDLSNQAPVTRPADYNRKEYISLIDDVLSGRYTGVGMQSITDKMLEENRQNVIRGSKPKQLAGGWGMDKITSMVPLPNKKVDANNQHHALISTDLPEENWPWPTSGWDWRDKFAKRLRSYTEGLLYFAQNDEELPLAFRLAAKQWGYAKDEFADNANFPRQVYVREGRRFEGLHFFTAHDAIAAPGSVRPPLHASSITASHYALDSHAVRKRESGKVHLDGFISYDSEVYTVPIGVMLPKTIGNLLLPVPVSGSHIGFSTLRMEPCWMALGQAAGVAAAQVVDKQINIQQLDFKAVQNILIDQKATLVYYKDVNPESPYFKMVQLMGLSGYLPDWKADLGLPVGNKTLTLWKKMSGLALNDFSSKSLKKDVILKIYEKKYRH